jgi:penicillin-binding protein 1C
VFGRGGSLEFPFPVAVKTGTSQAYHDNWTIGYTRDVTVGVWVGNFDRTPLRNSSGVTGAGPIFHAVMLAAVRRAGTGVSERMAIVERPDGLVEREVCATSGMPASPWCPARRRELLPADAGAPCTWHHQSDEGLLTIWPAQYQAWARQNGLMAGTVVPARAIAVHAAREGGASAPSLSIVSPPSGATYLIDPTLRREFQTLPLRVAGARPGEVTWSVDGRVIGRVAADVALHWPLAPGAHVIAARDSAGRSAEARVSVR